MIIFIIALVIDRSFFMKFLLAFLTEAVELEDMACDGKTFFGCLLLVGIGHRTDVDAFGVAAFGADQMMMVMCSVGKLVDVAGAAEDLVHDVKFCQQREVAVNRVERYVGLLFADFFAKLLGGGKRRTAGKGLKDGPALWCYLIALGAKQVKRRFFCHRMSPRLSFHIMSLYRHWFDFANGMEKKARDIIKRKR